MAWSTRLSQQGKFNSSVHHARDRVSACSLFPQPSRSSPRLSSLGRDPWRLPPGRKVDFHPCERLAEKLSLKLLVEFLEPLRGHDPSVDYKRLQELKNDG